MYAVEASKHLHTHASINIIYYMHLTYDTQFFILQQFLIQQSELQSSKLSCVHFLETERCIMRDANWLSCKQCGVSFYYQWNQYSP